jgi:hypothetical protein
MAVALSIGGDHMVNFIIFRRLQKYGGCCDLFQCVMIHPIDDSEG